MGIFTRKPAQVTLPTGRTIEVVYWTDVHEENLSQSKAGKCRLELVREPGNRADHNAITVCNEFGPIGYLPADEAQRYARALDRASVPVFVEAIIKDQKKANRRIVVGMPQPRDLSSWLKSKKASA